MFSRASAGSNLKKALSVPSLTLAIDTQQHELTLNKPRKSFDLLPTGSPSSVFMIDMADPSQLVI